MIYILITILIIEVAINLTTEIILYTDENINDIEVTFTEVKNK